MSIILGIDPGSRITGFGIVRVESSKKVYVNSGCIRLGAGSVAQRLYKISQELQSIVQHYQPIVVAVEQIFFHRNPTAALTLGQARGAAILGATGGVIPLAEYSARQVKQSVVGYGAASKQQVQQMVRVLLSLDDTPASDAADALAIALCHAQYLQTHPLLRDAQLLVKNKFRRGRRR